MIDGDNELTVTRQCELLEISRSDHYYKPKPVSERDLILMAKIDKLHMDYPFWGTRNLAKELQVGRGKIRRLMRKMGIEAFYIKPRLSEPHPAHLKYPYLLRNLEITRPNHVWAADITYVPMARGFCYLVAIMDWASRYVLAWRLSNSLDSLFCVEAIEEAIAKYGRPEIFNTDQGVQFTSEAFTSVLKSNEIKISMDGRGRWMDNVFIERLWRSVKYENIHIRAYESISEVRKGLQTYFRFYNERRWHQTFDRKTLAMVYFNLEPQGRVAA
jgi:putative transposase